MAEWHSLSQKISDFSFSFLNEVCKMVRNKDICQVIIKSIARLGNSSYIFIILKYMMYYRNHNKKYESYFSNILHRL